VVHGPITSAENKFSYRGYRPLTSQHFQIRYGGYRRFERGTWSGGHENDPSTQIHYSKCCPTWSKLAGFWVKLS